MDQKNILPRGIAKPIEQQPDGTWKYDELLYHLV